MDFAFADASRNLQRDNSVAKERARKKLEAQAKLKAKKQKLEKVQREQDQVIRKSKDLYVEEQTKREERERQEKANEFYSATLQFYIKPTEGDRMILPQSALATIQQQNYPSSVMTFQIIRNELITHGGVLEFTSDEGSVGIPLKIARKLEIDPTSLPDDRTLKIRCITIPKGTFTKLEPVEPHQFAQIADPRSHLQAILSAHSTTLTIGDSISVSNGTSTHLVNVIDLKPAEAVSLIDTELEVDLFIPSFVKKEKQEKPAEPFTLGSERDIELPPGDYVTYKVLFTKSDLDLFISGESLVEIAMALNYRVCGAAVCVSVSLFDVPQQFQEAKRFPLTSGDKQTFFLNHSDIPTYRESVPLYIKFLADDTVPTLETGAMAISISLKSNKYGLDQPSPQVHLVPSPEESICTNCHKTVLTNNLLMHETFCFRNNLLCSFAGCGQVVLKNQLEKHCHCTTCGLLFDCKEKAEKHHFFFHSSFPCLLCNSFTGPLERLREHRYELCAERLIVCKFCKDIVKSEGEPEDIRDKFHWNLSKHESRCGSKTQTCPSCFQNIRLKDFEFHSRMHKKLLAAPSPTKQPAIPLPITSANNYSPSHVTPEEPATPISCPICNITVASERLLNSHLDTKCLR